MDRYANYHLGKDVLNVIDVGIPQRNYLLKYGSEGLSSQKKFFEEVGIIHLFDTRIVIANSFDTKVERVEDEHLCGYDGSASKCQGYEGIITSTPNMPLFVAFGDCPQLMIVGENEIGIVHATYKTLNKDILKIFFRKFFVNNRISTTKVAFSPYLHQEHFTPKNLALRTISYLEKMVLKKESTYHLDIKSKIVEELEEIRIEKENIFDLGIDTYDLSKQSSKVGGYQTSHRQATDKEGRSGLVLMLKA
jgi:copper oxidase (laccase) domain-containing protein